MNVGNNPEGIAVSPDGSKLYFTDPNNNVVSVLDTVSYNIIATIPVGNSQFGIAVTSDGTKVYVANNNSGSVSVIDTITNTVINSVPVGNGSWGITVTSDGKNVYVTNSVDNTVSVVDTATNTVTATVKVGSDPFGVSVTQDGKQVYVANGVSGTVSVIDTAKNKVTSTIPVGTAPFAIGQFIAPLPAQPALPVANFSSNVTSGYAPLDVQFSDSSRNVTGWNWTFGDGSSSAVQNPAHDYAAPGNYTVTLTVQNEKGEDSKTAIITVLGSPESLSPVADFTTNVTSGYAPLSVRFTDNSQNANSWYWDFGDGIASTEQNPMHIYFKAGTYKVNLTASNGNGTDSKIVTLTVLQHPVYAYIANSGSDTVSIIDTATKKITATVSVGIDPWGVTVISDGSKVYVTNNGSNTVSVLDTAINKVTATVPVGNQPHGVAVTPDGTKVYVANTLDNTTSVIDTTTNAVIATVPLGTYPSGVAVTPDGTKVYFASATYVNNSTYNSILYVIDTATNTITATVPVGTASTGVAVNPDGTKVYVANGLDNTVSVLDTAANTVVATVPVGSVPWGIAVNPDGTKVYVSNSNDNTISVIDTATNTVTDTVPVGIYPFGVSVTPDGKEVYVANGVSDTVSVIDTATNKVEATVNVGTFPSPLGQFIEQPVLPFANFNSNVNEGYAPLSIQFIDLSKNAKAWNWNFGDGVTSTNQNPTHTYSIAGTYTVNLTVSNVKGSISKTATITVLDGSSSSGGSTSDGNSNGGSSDDSSSGGSSSGGSSSGGSSSSSGGGGGSPEPQSNVEVKEISQAFIASEKSAKFDFPQKATPVVYLSFDSKKTTGKTSTIVEMLKEKSVLVSELPSDEVYKSLNIWVGNSGFGSSENIENGVVNFKVEKSWIKDKNIDKSSITLNRYSDKKWDQLLTSLSGEDDIYLYFTTKTPGFSPFAIAGKTAPKGAATEEQSKPNTQGLKLSNVSTAANAEKTPEKTQSSNTSGKGSTKMPDFEAVCGIAGLLAVFLYKRK